MGGYNTITQTLAAGAPVICVPRVKPRREQLVRAEAFDRLGFLRYLLPGELSPARLRAEIECAIASSRPELRQRINATIEFDGAEFAAHHLLAMARSASVKNHRVTVAKAVV
jgi:predicted glycosyltransferase